MERAILHCDMNSYFASVELLTRPELREKPVAVCGDPEMRHGIILAKNEPAKAFGVKTAETIWQARKKCPDLILLPAHQHLYREYSRQINQIYLQYTDLVEPFSVDESFLDITGSMHLFGGDPEAIAHRIRCQVKEELGLTLSVGVSFNKVFAKLGSDYKKPDAVTCFSRENYKQLVWPLPVADLIYVGRSSAKVLKEHGITTIGELARRPRDQLELLLGKQGGALHRYANGEDNTPVHPYGYHEPPKSVGSGMTFRRDISGREEIYTSLLRLSGDVAVRLRKHDMQCTSVQVQIRDPNFKTISRQKAAPRPTALAGEIARTAMELVEKSWNLSSPIRMLTVTAQNLCPAGQQGEQMGLFSQEDPAEREKKAALERTMDSICKKFGNNAILPASVHGAKGTIFPKDGG